MSISPIIEHTIQQGRVLAKALPGLLHSATVLARQLPSNPWAMASLIAAASVLVTLVTLYFWPREAAPLRGALDTDGVRRMARRGLLPPDIARRTGLSHDAVATILRAQSLGRGTRTEPTRKTRPMTA
jgi:hypothetical protein